MSPAAAGPRLRAVANRGAAVLLGAVGVGWAAVPLPGKGAADLALVLAICAVVAGALRLALAGVPLPENTFLLPTPLRAWIRFLEILRLLPWEEGAVIAIVWLEVQHSARPWPTAGLGAVLIAYLLAVHLAESGAPPGALRPQARVLAAGAVPAGARRGGRDAARDRAWTSLDAAASGCGGRAHRRRRAGPALDAVGT